jgi:hypothetical protein
MYQYLFDIYTNGWNIFVNHLVILLVASSHPSTQGKTCSTTNIHFWLTDHITMSEWSLGIWAAYQDLLLFPILMLFPIWWQVSNFWQHHDVMMPNNYYRYILLTHWRHHYFWTTSGNFSCLPKSTSFPMLMPFLIWWQVSKYLATWTPCHDTNQLLSISDHITVGHTLETWAACQNLLHFPCWCLIKTLMSWW